jgi:hypothetical protein
VICEVSGEALRSIVKGPGAAEGELLGIFESDKISIFKAASDHFGPLSRLAICRTKYLGQIPRGTTACRL